MVSLEDISLTGNLIPHNWYYKVTNSRGHPDTNAIIILAEAFYWYRISTKENNFKSYNGSLQLGYDHFENKLNLSRDQIRNAFKRLEELNLIYRSFKTEYKFGSTYSNIMFLKLNIIEIKNITNKNILPSVSKFPTPSSEICEDNKEYKENNIRNRYLDKETSNFENSYLIEDADNTSLKFAKDELLEKSDSLFSMTTISGSNKDLLKPSTELSNSQAANRKTDKKSSALPISNFLPLNNDDVELLTKRVGKEFGKTFINALAQKLNTKYSDRKFLSKGIFLSYLEKALLHEKHDATKVNNINFAYCSPDDKYLERVESSNETSDVMKIKKRIAQEFEANLAVEILKKCYFPNITKNTKNYTFYVNDESFSLEEKYQAKLKRIILETTERYDLTTGEHFKFEKINIVKGNNYTEDKNKNKTITYSCQIEDVLDPIWQRVRERLKARYSAEVDKSWFSKIEFTYEAGEGRVILGFNNKFMSDHFEVNYGSTVNRYLQDEIEGLREVNHQIKSSNELVNVWFRERSRWLNQDEKGNALFHNLMARINTNLSQKALCSI
jgi:hypothetical protein